MYGQTVIVHKPKKSEVDPFGNEKVIYTDSVVEDVLVAPGASPDLVGGIRPENTQVTYTLHFPKTFMGVLDGCDITVNNERCRVIGSPRPMMFQNTPTRWNYPVEVELVYG